MDLRSRIVGRGLFLGAIQLALLYLVELSPSYLANITIELDGVLLFVLTIFMGFRSSGSDESLRTLLFSQLVVWPVLIFDSAPALTTSSVVPLIFTESIFLDFSGLVLSVVGFFGILLGALTRIFYDERVTAQEGTIDWYALKLRDEELLEKYLALRAKLRSGASWNDGDRVVLSGIVAEISRRGLKIDPMQRTD